MNKKKKEKKSELLTPNRWKENPLMSYHHIIVLTLGLDAFKSELGNIMSDVPNSELSQ